LRSKKGPSFKGDTKLVDKLLLGRKLSDLETYLKQLREFSGISAASYRNDWKTQRVVERTLQMLIELCIDIANHIISDKGMRLPTGYADTFTVLKENRVIGKGLFSTMERMAKFRNLIVHQYEEIDAAIVVSILKKNLNDFDKYKNTVLKFIKQG
jgi:uncharacterized protein YutE (UPF0331/DUF86 family)